MKSTSFFKSTFLIKLFCISLLTTTIISFIILFDVILNKNKKYKYIFNTWQFPMLLALLLDVLYILL